MAQCTTLPLALAPSTGSTTQKKNRHDVVQGSPHQRGRGLRHRHRASARSGAVRASGVMHPGTRGMSSLRVYGRSRETKEEEEESPVGVPNSSTSHKRGTTRRALSTRTCAAGGDGDGDGETPRVGRRHSAVGVGLLLAGLGGGGGARAAKEEEPTAPGPAPRVTDTVYLDIGLCDSIVRADRALGSQGGGAVCDAPRALGRVTIGLYGERVPRTVEMFTKLVSAPPGEGYVGTVFHRVEPGRFVLAGQRGSARLGQVQPGTRLPPNPELLDAASFRLTHSRPGTVSLALAAAAGEVDGYGSATGSISGGSGGRNTEFLITTGPAPVPSLDGENIVFGRVLEGMEVIAAVAAVPTFKPSSNSRAWNQVAEWLKDERAEKARAVWNKPTKAIVITGGGVLYAAPV